MKKFVAIVLAAGKGKRMKSSLPKILHPVCGYPMIEHVLKALEQLKIKKVYLVAGYGEEKVREYVKNRAVIVLQKEQLGTGHAVQQAVPHLKNFKGSVLVLSGDMPLLRSEDIRLLLKVHKKSKSPATMMTADVPWETDFGRVIRGKNGKVERIVEAREAAPEELAAKEVNLGTYCFEAGHLLKYLKKIGRPNMQNEIYLTDVVLTTAKDNLPVEAVKVSDPEVSLGINSRKDLAIASKILQKRILDKFMLEGVTIIHPESTFIDIDVKIGKDTVIYPSTMIEGKTKIGENCKIGPFTRIISCKIASDAVIQNSVLMESIIEEDANIGPFAYIRPGSVIGKGVKVGDFVEIKKSKIGELTKVPHLSYIGDATIGKKVNIGAGVITCNFDGAKKHPTTIKDNAYIGANTNLVAPVTVGKGAKTGAGAVVIENVPDNTLAVGVPARVKKSLKAELTSDEI